MAAHRGRRPRSGHESGGAGHPSATLEDHDCARVDGFHPRAKHGRRVRHSERRGLPIQDGGHSLIATTALVGVAMYAANLAPHQRVARAGLALIIGGAAGNLIDRVLAGSVVDFVDVYWRTYHFWAFNVADSAISVGVTMLILDMLMTGPHVSTTV